MPGQEIFHWGTWFDNDHFAMDYDSHDWVPAGAGRWNRANVTNATAGYHKLDLYLMGLLARSEVGTITYINNPTFNAALGVYEGPAVNLAIDDAAEAGLDPFVAVDVREMAITLKQGWGRLVRTAADRGVLALLDTSFHGSSYERVVRATFPARARVTDKMGAISRFLGRAVRQAKQESHR